MGELWFEAQQRRKPVRLKKMTDFPIILIPHEIYAMSTGMRGIADSLRGKGSYLTNVFSLLRGDLQCISKELTDENFCIADCVLCGC